MPKKLLTKILPNPNYIRNHKNLRFLRKFSKSPALWSVTRRPVSKGVFIGLFVMWVPLPFQMLYAATLAIYFKANLPISVALVWITNPLTIPPMFYFSYLLGTKIIEKDIVLKDNDFDSLIKILPAIWEPLWVGSLSLSVISAISGYLVIRIVWKLSILLKLKKKRDQCAR